MATVGTRAAGSSAGSSAGPRRAIPARRAITTHPAVSHATVAPRTDTRPADRQSVLRYAARRVGEDTAGDIAGETFSIAWRRLRDVPPRDADVLPWLYGVARRVIANEERRERRSGRLLARLASFARSGRTAAGDPGEDVVAATALEEVLHRMSPAFSPPCATIG
ncbi:hypothetical protein OG320_09765 [Microbispora sp. NBC_01189]|uniref:RNA polymerase sigma factor n=1 Tax=Microbispora sp. NBC_01189 TaxID=2903583 RepID=UPI002E104B3B|nr:hypothetical protein OG320_09765 [Microbispora sp. NBC_01189]